MAYSYIKVTATAGQTSVPFNFDYLSTTEIKVSINDIEITAWSLSSPNVVALNSALAGGEIVEIERVTDLTTRAVDFASGAVLTEEDLDLSAQQVFNAAQEAIDSTEKNLSLDYENNYDSKGRRITDVGDAVDPGDVITKRQLDYDYPAVEIVSDNINDVNTVASNITDINTVEDNITDINTVAGNISSVNTVGTNITNVNKVAVIDTDVTTVAGISSDVSTVSGNNTNISTVAGISSDVTTVAGISSDVTDVANNLTDVSNFADVYLGAKASDPSTRNDGTALQAGDLYFNTTVDELRTYSGSQWVSGTAGTMAVQRFTGDGSTTAFTLSTAPSGENNTQVYVNGIYQQKDTYSVSGTSLTLTEAPQSDEEVEVVTISTLALGETDASLVSYTSSGTGAVARTVQGKLGEFVSVKDFGAVGDGTTDDTAAIQAAIDAVGNQGVIRFPSATYRIDSIITVTNDNITIQGNNSTILPSNNVAQQAFMVNGADFCKIKDLNFEGTGTAFSDGNQRLLQIQYSNNFVLEGCTFVKSRGGAVVIANCTSGRVSNCVADSNYGVGVTVRDNSANITVDSCTFTNNGDTGIAQGPGGRGLLFWQSSNCTATNCTFSSNKEYGLRLYSQAGDAQANRNIAISNCVFYANGSDAAGKIDLYIYDGTGLTERVAVTGCTFNTRADNISVVLSGKYTTLSGCVMNALGDQSGTAVSLYKATNAVCSGNTIRGFSSAFQFSQTSGAETTNVTIADNQIQDIVVFSGAGIVGGYHLISNNRITHGGSGTSDYCFTITGSTVNCTLLGNYIDGFARGIYISTTGHVELRDNTTVNSTNIGLNAQYMTNVDNIITVNNNFDSAYPQFWGTMFSDAFMGHATRSWSYPYPPSTGGVNGGANTPWSVGDKVYKSNPTAGGSIGWVCTTAGAPGTWKEFGDIQT